MKPALLLVLFSWLFSMSFCAKAQEETEVVYQSKQYISLNIKSLDKYNARVQKQQEKLLRKLVIKENKYSHNLKKQDPDAYKRYQAQTLTFDSISKLQKVDTDRRDRRIAQRSNAPIDSLIAIQSFLKEKIHLKDDSMSGKLTEDSRLNKLKNQGNYNSYINDLIAQRTSNLKNINSAAKVNPGIFNGMAKDVFYAKEKMKVFKSMSDEPSAAEELALEKLQGQDGFEQYLHSPRASKLAAFSVAGSSSADLEKMGYQTKKMLNAEVQSKFGNNLGGLQEKVGGQVKDYQDQLRKLQAAKNEAVQTQGSLKKIKHLDKPEFKVNPMRGLSLIKRIEKQFSWQTYRPTINGNPAMFQFAALAGFKHTPKLTYGLGIATSVGLGQSWNNIHFSLQGIGLRAFANWQLIYGIGAYAGYDRMYKQAAFFNDKTLSLTEVPATIHNTKTYSESVLIGVSRAYSINGKWNGGVQVLYDIWWKEKGLKNPIVLRITSTKK